jgi:phospholipase C
VEELGSKLRSRREVLAGGVTAALGVALAGCSSTVAKTTAKAAASVRPAGSDLGAIEHVVFLTMENRSFDHYFGTYRGVRGFDDAKALPGVFAQQWPNGSASHVLPFHLDTATTDAMCTLDLSHAWEAQHRSWNAGRMDRWVATHTSPQYEGTNGTLTMGYYTRKDIPYWYALADAFTICDNYFCSVLGPTHPNRLHALSGTLGPDGAEGGPILVTNYKHEFVGSLTWRTMPEELEAKGVSWKVYNPPGAIYQPDNPLSMLISDNILLYFKRHVSDPTSPLYQKAFGPLFPTDFGRDVANDTLPAVSWIVPPLGYDEHPPGPPAAGEWFANQVLEALVSNPKVWAKTVLFITYDENDGFFDHVAPPVPPKGTPGEYLTVSPLPADAAGQAGPIGFGVRVPALVVSPFSRGGYVYSGVSDHTSMLRLVETRFGVKAPNISAWRRSTAGDLTASLQGGSPNVSLPTLPTTDARGPKVTSECTTGQLSEINVSNPATYPLPAAQRLPRQEPGAARRLV